MNDNDIKAVPVLQLFERGYLYGKTEVGSIYSSDKAFTSQLHDLVLKLSKAVRERDVADTRRSTAKMNALPLVGEGNIIWRGLAWRARVNDLNAQKKHVNDVAEAIMSLLKNSDQFDILQEREDEGIVSIKENLMGHDQNYLLKFFQEGRVQIL